jgi:outer membrane biosynthesis protein TonB
VKAELKDTPPVVASQEDLYVPPKLLKAIRSLSPPEALRAYVSGVVTLDTVVDEGGRVQSATPMSGPKALYKKAVDTVKDYVYQPATRNGKPVPAHLEVKIQFWYEP